MPVHGVDAEMLCIISDQVFWNAAARLLSPPSLDSLTLLHFYLQSFPEVAPGQKTPMWACETNQGHSSSITPDHDLQQATSPNQPSPCARTHQLPSIAVLVSIFSSSHRSWNDFLTSWPEKHSFLFHWRTEKHLFLFHLVLGYPVLHLALNWTVLC